MKTLHPQDLRIGNYVIHEIDDMLLVASVEMIAQSHCETEFIDVIPDDLSRRQMDVSYEYIEPIPLTEERLKELGFRPFHNSNEYFKKYNITKGFKAYFCLFSGEGYYYIDDWDTQIEYVHELQNLYFALTGEELTINDSAPVGHTAKEYLEHGTFTKPPLGVGVIDAKQGDFKWMDEHPNP